MKDRVPLFNSRLENRLRLGEDGAQDLLDLVEFLLTDDQRWRELDDRVATIVGAALIIASGIFAVTRGTGMARGAT